jgi:hypothetical protein
VEANNGVKSWIKRLLTSDVFQRVPEVFAWPSFSHVRMSYGESACMSVVQTNAVPEIFLAQHSVGLWFLRSRHHKGLYTVGTGFSTYAADRLGAGVL